MTDESPSPNGPVFPQYAPPGLTVADPKQAKPLLKLMNRMLVRPRPRVSRMKKGVDKPRRQKDKVRVI